MDPTVFRCVYCRQALCHADFAISPYCPVCGQNKFSPAVMIEDDEMKALIQRGYAFAEEKFVYIDDNLRKKGILPNPKLWIKDDAA